MDYVIVRWPDGTTNYIKRVFLQMIAKPTKDLISKFLISEVINKLKMFVYCRKIPRQAIIALLYYLNLFKKNLVCKIFKNIYM